MVVVFVRGRGRRRCVSAESWLFLDFGVPEAQRARCAKGNAWNIERWCVAYRDVDLGRDRLRTGGGRGRGWGWGDVSVGFFPMTRHAHCFSFLFCFPTAGQVRSIVGAHSRTACTRVATWALDAVRVRGARAAAPRWTAAEESWEAMEKAISSRRPWLCRREVRTCSLCCLNSQKILERRRLCGFIQK